MEGGVITAQLLLPCQLLVQLREYEHGSAANQHEIADTEEMEGCVVRQKEPVVTRLRRLPDR